MKKRNGKIFWGVYVLSSVLVLIVLLWFRYGNMDFSENQKKNAKLIGLSYMTMNNEFYKIMSEEINARIEAEGDLFILRDPALSVENQIEQIHEMIDQGVDVLVVTPVDSKKLIGVLKEAKKKGIYIVVLDSDIEEPEIADCTITSDNYNAGVIVGEYFLKKKKSARVLVMTHDKAKSGQNRVKGFIDTVTQNKNIKIVREVECEGQMEIAMPQIKKVIQEGEQFDSAFCLNDLSSVGVVAALKGEKYLDKVEVYGVDASPDAKSLIKEGMMMASAAQFPSQIGEKAAKVIYQLLNGEKVEKRILVPVKLVTSENVEKFGTNRWQ